MYNNFATAADETSAIADIDAAVLRIGVIESNLRLNRTLLNAGIGKTDLLLGNLADEFSKVSTEQLDAKQAERRAVTVRFDLAVNNLALIALTNLTYVNGLFLSPDPMEKQDIWDVIRGPLPEGFVRHAALGTRSRQVRRRFISRKQARPALPWARNRHKGRFHAAIPSS